MMRFARYAAATMFALLVLGFVVLWVRSLESLEMVTGSLPGVNFTIASHRNFMAVTIFHFVAAGQESEWYTGSMRLPRKESIIATNLLGFSAAYDSGHTVIAFPHWFVAASSLGLAALFAFKRTWRYSVRTILVATTLLAALLGLVVYAV
jgi:hypothetical protein